MASTYTTNLGIEKIADGEQSETWGDTTNTNFDLIDQGINGIISITLASAGTSGSPNDLPITDGTVSDGRNKFIEFVDGGDLGATAYVQLTPNDAEKLVFIRNSLSASRSLIVFQGTYNASNDFEVPNGHDVVLKFDGAGAGSTVTQVFSKLSVSGLNINNAYDLPTSDGSADQVLITDGSGTISFSAVSGIGALLATNNLSDLNNAATARTNLGLGTAATTASTDYATAAQGALADSALQNLVEDTTPQLGGNLDINGNKIVSTSNGNIDIEPNGTGNVLLGNLTFDADQTVGAGQDNYVLTYDNSAGVISLEAATGGGLTAVVDDTTPQLGGNLDLNSNDITGTGNVNITGTIDATSHITTTGRVIAGEGSGSIALTANDGYGNANLTFNHEAGIPDKNGNAGRIEVNVDSTSNAYIDFELKSNVTSGGAVSLTQCMRIEEDGDVHANGDVIAYSTTISDVRLKSDLEPITDALSKVNQLSGYTFTRNHNGEKSAGVIAQELEKVLPEAIKEKELPLQQDDGERYKVVEYDAIHGLLIQAIKELSGKVEELEGKIYSK